jgi:hypothetical protein
MNCMQRPRKWKTRTRRKREPVCKSNNSAGNGAGLQIIIMEGIEMMKMSKIFVDKADIVKMLGLLWEGEPQSVECVRCMLINLADTKPEMITEAENLADKPIPYLAPEIVVKSIKEEFRNRQAILKLADMLGEYANDGDAGPGHPVLPRRDLKMRDKCYEIQRMFVNEDH